MKLRKLLSTVTVYVAVILAALSIATLKMRAQGDQPAAAPAVAASPQASPQPGATPIKPHFSLATNRTYGTHEKARVYISYQGIESLDFRVYKIKDPFKFFKQLANPHLMGQNDREMVSEVTETQNRKPSFLEKLRSFKSDIYFSFKGYFRNQIRRDARTAFNDKYRSGERLPIDRASYAQVPLLNPDQLEDSFKQILTPLDNRWDTRMVVLGQKTPGVYLVEGVNGKLRAYTIAVVSDLTMISKIAHDGEVMVYTVDRKSGEPRDDANVQIVKGNKVLASAKTGKDGLMRVTVNQPKDEAANANDAAEPEGDENVGPDDFLILADRKGEFAVSDLASYFFNWSEGEESPAGNLTSYIYTDRPVYRPEQKAYFKGILRQLTDGGYQLPQSHAVHVAINDPDGKEIFQKDLNLTPRGTFSGEVDIAAGAPLGSYGVVVHLNGVEAARGFFEVAEYKKPEYKVKVSTPKTFVATGEKTKFTVEAKYYFGSPVKNADVKYYIYRSPYYPWWWENEDDGIGESEEQDEEGYGYGNDMVKEGEGRLDENGRLEIAFDVPQPGANESRDFTYRLEAMVTDSARREIEGKVSFIGTRGNVSVRANADRYVYYKGETAKIRVRTRDYDGKPVAAKVTLKFSEVRWQKIEKEENGFKYNEYKRNLTSVSAGEVTTNAEGEATFEYKTTGIGDFDINAVVTENGRQIEHEAGSFYVTSETDSWVYNAWRDEGSIKLIADKKSYKVGETAKILAMLPTDKAHLLVTTEMARVLETRHVYADSRAVVIELPIKDTYSPNIQLSVAYVKNGEMFEHSKNIAVPSVNKFLNIELIPDKQQYKPRDPASYQIVAKNADGSPAAGVEVSLGLVDEAIYAVRPDTSGDIRRAFYGTRYTRVSTNFAAAFQFTGFSGDKKIDLAQNKHSYQLADFKDDSQYAEPKIRKDFRDTAFWQSDVVTAADGKATVRLNLPDNLTTWRATARAVTADLKVGSKVDKILSRKDLILRLETPRFATEGDTVTISGIVHNYQKEEKVTQVELKVTGAQLLDAGQRTVTIPKDGEQRIDWRISAANFGNVTLLATAKTNGESDGVELPMPVVAAGTHVVKGESLALSEDSAQKEMSFVLPGNAHAQARTLRIEASPSVAGAMFGALDYLTSYPYGCTEQTMSSFLPNVIVAQTVKEVKSASVSTGNDLSKKVQRGLQRLYSYQHEDGGWGWWKDDKTDPFMTAYVMDGLALAERAGYGVEPYRIQQGRKKIQQLLDTGKMEDGTPFDIESRAYLLYAQQVSGGADARYVGDMFNRRGEMQPYARALLALTLKSRNDNRAQLVASDIERSVKMTQAEAYWDSKRRPMLDFTEENGLEATAWSLKALAQINPNSELLAKSARWLVAHRQNGYYWDTTKHTAFAIFALTDYLRASKELTADYTLEVYLNSEQVLTRRVTAAEAANGQPIVIERKGASISPTSSVRVIKRGAGVAYVAVTQDFYTKEETSDFSAGGLKLTREYLRLKVGDEGGKPVWKTEPLTGEMRSGDMIVSRLRVMGAKSQYLLIEDPIPAGCEQVERFSGFDFSFATSGWSDWYSQREFRDQRTALFVSYFDGDATFQYAMRVQTPGQFRVAPARAELMYQPSAHANTANYRLNILDKK